LQITTTAPASVGLALLADHRPERTIYSIAFPGMLTIGSLFAAKRRRRWGKFLAIALLVCAGAAVTACGGGNSGSNGAQAGTPASSSKVTVTAADGNQIATATFTLVVQ